MPSKARKPLRRSASGGRSCMVSESEAFCPGHVTAFFEVVGSGPSEEGVARRRTVSEPRGAHRCPRPRGPANLNRHLGERKAPEGGCHPGGGGQNPSRRLVRGEDLERVPPAGFPGIRRERGGRAPANPRLG